MTGSTRDWVALLVGGAGLVLSLAAPPAWSQDAAARYAALRVEADSLGRYSAYLERVAQTQLAEIASLERQIADLDVTNAEFAPLLQRMFDELAGFVSTDLPFQSTERSERVERLRQVLANPETPVAERYRRLLEAYQIEMEYGRTMEFFPGELADKGEVHFVRLGRVALMYATPDGSETGYWDMDQKAWVVDPEQNAGIQAALRIAREEGTADLITVPVPAAAAGR